MEGRLIIEPVDGDLYTATWDKGNGDTVVLASEPVNKDRLYELANEHGFSRQNVDQFIDQASSGTATEARKGP